MSNKKEESKNRILEAAKECSLPYALIVSSKKEQQGGHTSLTTLPSL